MVVPTADDFIKWLKEKMGMELEEFEALNQGAKDLIYIGFKATWRGNPSPQKEIRAYGAYRAIVESIRKVIAEPVHTKQELFLKAREKSTVSYTYGEFIDTLSELLTWGLIIYRDGRYWR